MTDNTQVGLKRWCEAFIDGDISAGQFKRAIQSVIRTEKLKLLAEIGEPKLGDVVLMQPEQYKGGVIIDDWYKNRINKLEAEL